RRSLHHPSPRPEAIYLLREALLSAQPAECRHHTANPSRIPIADSLRMATERQSAHCECGYSQPRFLRESLSVPACRTRPEGLLDTSRPELENSETVARPGADRVTSNAEARVAFFAADFHAAEVALSQRSFSSPRRTVTSTLPLPSPAAPLPFRT